MKLHWRLIEARYWYVKRPAEKLLLKLVWKLPRRLVMWCCIRVLAHATTGQFGNQVVPELNAMEALRRWDVPHVSR